MSMRLGLEPADGKLERVCDRCFVLLQSVQRKDRGATVKKVGAVTHQDTGQPHAYTHSYSFILVFLFIARGREATSANEATFSSFRGYKWRGGA